MIWRKWGLLQKSENSLQKWERGLWGSPGRGCGEDVRGETKQVQLSLAGSKLRVDIAAMY